LRISTLKSFGKDPLKVSTLRSDLIGFYNCDVGLGESTDGMRILAIADMNNDKYDDLITLNSAGNVVTVRYFNKETLTYLNSFDILLETTASVTSAFITTTPTLLQNLLLVVANNGVTKFQIYD